MKHGIPGPSCLLILGLFVAVPAGPAPGQTAEVPAELATRYDSAYFAWSRGDYPAALRHAEHVLTAPGGEALLDRVALLTGEKYRVRPVAPDGRGVRWSRDGHLALFETGAGVAVRTHVVTIDGAAVTEAAVLPGRSATVSPDGRSVAYLSVPETEELAAARAAERVAQAARDFGAVRRARVEIARLEAAAARIMVRELATGRDVERAAGRDGAAVAERYGLLYAGDGSLVLVGRAPGEETGALFVVPERGQPGRLGETPGTDGAVVAAVGDRRVLQTVDAGRFIVVDVPTGAVVLDLAGSSPTASADGSVVAFLEREPIPAAVRRGEAVVGADRRGERALTRLRTVRAREGAEPVDIVRTTLPLASPALSPTGELVAFQKMPRDSWEVYTATTDGSGDARRITVEVQHDQFPRFVTPTRLLAMQGEFRHRRAYLYDLSGDRRAAIAADPLPGRDQRGRTRAFHNNTLRTVAPQYEWAPSPDGRRILVVAHRDGNTLSPAMGVWVVDLDRPVTRDDVLARIRANLAAELELRESGRRLFSPIEAEVRAAVAMVDVGRVHDHGHALYQLGSKWFTEPGNRLAIDYLATALRRMGYEPELQWFEPRPGHRTANVVATLRGTERPDRIHVISSHFDSVEGSPGADDNSSGTTALLEAARALAGRPQPETIRFAFLTAEEAGLLGAIEFVRRARADGDRVISVVNNDMIGWTRSHRLDNTVRYSNDAIRDAQHAAAILFTDLITYDARYVRGTDAQVFYDAYGDIVGGIGSYPILGNPHYHQASDKLEVINHRLVAEVSRATVATVMALASGLVTINPGD
jgi:hypothetical protein